MHRSCVITATDLNRAPTGVAPCSYARYNAQGQVIAAAPLTYGGDNSLPATINGWVASADTKSAGPIGYLAADWLVPTAPTTNNNQTLYYFPGLESTAQGNTILQPVLGWNAFGDSAWTLASWNCCLQGNVFQ